MMSRNHPALAFLTLKLYNCLQLKKELQTSAVATKRTSLEAIATRVEAIASRLEAIATSVEAIAVRMEAIGIRSAISRLEEMLGLVW